MIERYSLPEISVIWEEQARFSKWLKIEVLVCEALAKKGKIPAKALSTIKKKASFNVNRIAEIENEVQHDVIAFLTSVAEKVGPDSRFIHQGLTSSDLLDTALSLQMRDAANLILNKLEELKVLLKAKAKKYKDTIMIGRTHGIHAEPVSFGLKLAIWWKETERNIERLRRAKDTISVGKISGAVGTYSNIDPYVEEYVCRKLGIKPAPVSSQIVQRDRHAEYLNALAVLASSLEKFATEIRHLQRTEVLEVEEPFKKGQKGSSAMPHKRNPVICERIAGLARVVRANAVVGMENISLWHERDISHSSAERIIIPDSTILVYYILTKFIKIIDGLLVYPVKMKKNLELTKGLMFSQKVMIMLTKKGMTREQAYRLVQKNAMQVWNSIQYAEPGYDFKTLLMKDNEVRKYLNKDEIEKCFDLKAYLRNLPNICKRLKI